ncbi:hypothetical protein ACLQ24_14435, partial [Micromonospora sp. DT4]
MSEPVNRARRTLNETPADRLVGGVGTVLDEAYGITEAELYQVDYRLGPVLWIMVGGVGTSRVSGVLPERY